MKLTQPRKVFDTEKHTLNGVTYEVVFVPKELFKDPAQYGAAFLGSTVAHVRVDLPHVAQRFVVYHELYHLIDPYTWGNWWGSEIRANLVAGICNPVGLLVTVCLTLLSPERRSLYKRRFQHSF